MNSSMIPGHFKLPGHKLRMHHPSAQRMHHQTPWSVRCSSTDLIQNLGSFTEVKSSFDKYHLMVESGGGKLLPWCILQKGPTRENKKKNSLKGDMYEIMKDIAVVQSLSLLYKKMPVDDDFGLQDKIYKIVCIMETTWLSNRRFRETFCSCT